MRRRGELLTGVLTGSLMTRFCPDPALSSIIVNTTTMETAIPSPSPPQLGGDPYQCWSAAIWGIITLTTASSFFVLLLVRRFVTVTVAPKPGVDGAGGSAVELVVVRDGQEGLDGVLKVEFDDDEDPFADDNPSRVEDFNLDEDVAAVLSSSSARNKKNKSLVRS